MKRPDVGEVDGLLALLLCPASSPSDASEVGTVSVETGDSDRLRVAIGDDEVDGKEHDDDEGEGDVGDALGCWSCVCSGKYKDEFVRDFLRRSRSLCC